MQIDYDTEQFWLEHYGEPSGVRCEVVHDWERFGFSSEYEYNQHIDEQADIDQNKKDLT